MPAEPEAGVDIDAIDYFTDPSLVDDPFPYFEGLRARGPVTPLAQHGVLAVTGYDEAAEVWRDADTFSSCIAVTGPFPGLGVEVSGDDITDVIAERRSTLPMHEYLIAEDPPEHTADRGLLMRLLTPRRLKENESFIEQLAGDFVDALVPRGELAVLGDFAQPFALLVIADLLGIPEADHKAFASQLGASHPEPGVGSDRPRSDDPLAFLNETFAAYVEDRRREPRADVLTHLATTTYPDGSLPDIASVVRTATFLFAAGQDTTARLITATVKHLGEDPALQDRVRAEPERIPDLLEEVLRLEGPVKTVSRLARVSTTVGDHACPAGTTVAIFPHATNRDPRRFEAPDELRLDRPNVREHLAFGRGIHSCPGGPLARVEARIALERLLAATSSIRISEEHHGPAGARRYDYVPTYILRGVNELHVEVEGRSTEVQ